MYLTCCGISHQTASLASREIFQISRGDLMSATADFKEITESNEAVVLATCNRIEFYAVKSLRTDPLEDVRQFYQQRGVVLPNNYRELFFVRHESSVGRHLFKVISGLDSVVLGESQIVRQVKDAYSAACSAEGPGPVLHKLFHFGFQTSKRVRTETNIGDGVNGFAGAAVGLVRRLVEESQRNLQITIIGVNTSTETLLSKLKHESGSITLINRTVSKAERLARKFGCKAVSLDELKERLNETDVLFSATSSNEFVVTPALLKERHGRPILMVDLAIPRDIDPLVVTVAGVMLYDLDDLKDYLDSVSRDRTQDIPYALQLIEEQLSAFESWRLSSQTSDFDWRTLIDQDRQAILDKFRDSFKPGEQKALEAFSRQLSRQILRRLNTLDACNVDAVEER